MIVTISNWLNSGISTSWREEFPSRVNRDRSPRIKNLSLPQGSNERKEPAMTYFRTVGHYHRLHVLNGRVRNGNVCFHMDMVTGNRH